MARGVARGDIWQYRFAAPDKRRPVLVIGRDSLLAVLQTATVAPITSTGHGSPVEVTLDTEHGLKNTSFANLANIMTVRQEDLRQWVGNVGPQKLTEVCQALALAAGCD